MGGHSPRRRAAPGAHSSYRSAASCRRTVTVRPRPRRHQDHVRKGACKESGWSGTPRVRALTAPLPSEIGVGHRYGMTGNRRAGRTGELADPAASTDSRRLSDAPLAISVDSRAPEDGGQTILWNAPGWRFNGQSNWQERRYPRRHDRWQGLCRSAYSRPGSLCRHLRRQHS